MKNAGQYKAIGAYGTVGLEIVLSILLGLWIGTKMDGWLGTSPWMAVLWFSFGCGAAIKAVHRSWKEMQAAAKREEAEQGNPEPLFPDDKSLAWQREAELEKKRREARENRSEDDEQTGTDETEKRDV
jgi:ATP synthase protein I